MSIHFARAQSTSPHSKHHPAEAGVAEHLGIHYSGPRDEYMLSSNEFNKFGIFGITTSEASTPNPNRGIKSSDIKAMPEQGNMPKGFARMRIDLQFADGTEKVTAAGSFFSFETGAAKADFISKKSHPELFSDGVDFEKVKKYFNAKGQDVALIVAGAYYTSDNSTGTNQIEGLAIEDGSMVGQAEYYEKLNGLLVIDNGVPQIQYVNLKKGDNAFLAALKDRKADLFQQTSYIRPGVSPLSPSVTTKFDLRFFVEGEMNGVPKKGIINFSTSMTYSDAIEALTEMQGFKITKAIGLDTGSVSEGYFYDRAGKGYQMIDENLGVHRDEYTNVLVLHN